MTLSPTNFVTVPLPGNSSYTSYMLVFPTLRDATSTNSMHISEIQLDTTCGADFGPISSSSTPLSFHTLASDFDTELALFDAAGNLLESNDDISPTITQSQIDLPSGLAAGTYYLALGAFSTFFNPAFNVSTTSILIAP